MKQLINYLLFISFSFMILSCGEGVVEVTNKSYEPKIAIEGYLIAGQQVDKIRISRNFPIDANLTRMSLLPEVNQTIVTITDIAEDRTYSLTFHVAPDNLLENYYWQYNNPSFKIKAGNSYRLNVTANIDGKELQASSTTTVPDSGFSISHLNYNQLMFREHDQNNSLKHFEITFNRSPGISFYLASAKALNPSKSNFIYDNPFFNEEPEDVEVDDYNYQYGWVQDTPTTIGQTTFTVFWANLWFFDNYEIIMYATDDNYREFVQTYNDVQEDDGNFHEAIFNIEGDGIGVFGSMIADTAYIEVLRN
jgi:uncharacterized protein DUF4249